MKSREYFPWHNFFVFMMTAFLCVLFKHLKHYFLSFSLYQQKQELWLWSDNRLLGWKCMFFDEARANNAEEQIRKCKQESSLDQGPSKTIYTRE